MTQHTGERPVVIGAAISGLAVSYYLSKHGIPHVLIGRRPAPTRPRLGESLDLVGSLEMQLEFPQYAEYYHPKDNIGFYKGDHAGVFCTNLTGPIIHGLCRMIGIPFIPLIHLDRVGFDSRFYDDVTRAPHCTAIESTVVGIDHDDNHDRVTGVVLDNGERLKPTFLFDASGFESRQLLDTALRITSTPVGRSQYVAFTHYLGRDGNGEAGGPPPGWKHATNLLRLVARYDEVDGVAWAIPLGSYISVGVSVDADANRHSDDDLIRLTDAAYERRGVEYKSVFAEPTRIKGIPYQHTRTPRIHGANWVQIGYTSNQVWFTSSSSVGTSCLVANLAPMFLRSPRRAGRLYERYVQSVWRTHWCQDGIFNQPVPDTELGAYRKLWGDMIGFISSNEDRYMLYSIAKGHENSLQSALRFSSQIVKKLSGHVAVLGRRYVSIARPDGLGEQSQSIYAAKIAHCRLVGPCPMRGDAGERGPSVAKVKLVSDL